MKDYYNSDVDFIEGYQVIKGEEIHLYFNDGHTWIVPYTDNNETKIKRQMVKQAKKIKEQKVIYKKEKTKNLFLLGLTVVGGISLNVFLKNQFLLDPIKHILLNGTLTCVCLPIIKKVLKNKIQLREIEKVKIFLEHEQEINERSKENPNILGLSSKKIKNKDLTINNYDDLTLKELRNIRNNLIRDKNVVMDFKVKEKKRQL
ncbi:MAG: hypothetical protein ACOXZR_00095 [Bacilli bacterium]|jgi:hypothetical protein